MLRRTSINCISLCIICWLRGHEDMECSTTHHIEELRKRYSQNSIIYCKEDNSYHRVLKWGANVQGIQRIIAEPYIVEEVIPHANYTVYISNYGSLYIDLFETYHIDELYKEISNTDLSVGEQEKSIVLI